MGSTKGIIAKIELDLYILQKKNQTQWAEPVSLTFHSALRKLNTEPPIGASHQVWVIWLSNYREIDIQKSTNKKQEWPVVARFINESELNEQSLQMTFQGCFLPSFDSFGKAVSEKKIFQKSTNQKQELSVAAMCVNGSELNDKSLQRTFQGCFLANFDSFGQAVTEKIFQKSTNQKQELSVAAIFDNGSGRNEQSLQRKYHRCFLPSFGSFG